MGDASREIMRQARRQVPEWSPSKLHEALAIQHEAGPTNQEIVLVDVREKHEWDEGHLPGAIHVPRGYLELQIEEAVPDKSKTIVLYCAGGVTITYGRCNLTANGVSKSNFYVWRIWAMERQWISICATAHDE